MSCSFFSLDPLDHRYGLLVDLTAALSLLDVSAQASEDLASLLRSW